MLGLPDTVGPGWAQMGAAGVSRQAGPELPEEAGVQRWA